MRFRVVLPLLIIAGALVVVADSLRACAAERLPVLEGMVTQVTDGDTIKVELQSGPITVRLDSIDTPEWDQPYGDEATVALSELLASGEVELEVITQDRYERLVAVVYAGSASVNERMVRDGHAWAYRQYLKDSEYCGWEEAGRDRKKGLWRLPPDQSVAPWEWRAIKRRDISVATDYTNETVEI